MRSPKIFLALCLMLPGLSGCRGDGTGPGGPSWFRASLSGEVARSYEGTGDFAVLRDDIHTPRYFRLFSSSPAGSEVRERFYIRWPDDARPGPGTYPLVPHADAYGSPEGVTGVYRWDRGDNVSSPHAGELYVALAGVVEITRSTDDEIEGTIRFSGTQIGKDGPWGSERADPAHHPDPAAPKVEVNGSFRATRWDEQGFVVTQQ